VFQKNIHFNSGDFILIFTCKKSIFLTLNIKEIIRFQYYATARLSMAIAYSAVRSLTLYFGIHFCIHLQCRLSNFTLDITDNINLLLLVRTIARETS